MKLNVRVILNLQTDKVISLAEKAGRLGVRDIVVAIARDTIHPPSPVLTGHNRRSMAYIVEGLTKHAMGTENAGEPRFIDWTPDVGHLQGAVYSTSGYGGWLEVGTAKMSKRPYIKPAFDRHIGDLPGNIKRHFDKF